MKKKILIVASTMIHIENFHLPYIEELKKDYEVFTMAKGVAFAGKHADFDVNFEKKIISVKNLKNVKVIRDILEAEKFDAVILNTSLASFYVRLAVKKMKNRPIVINIVHGYLFGQKSNPFKKLAYLFAEKFVKKQTDHILVMNEEDRDIAKKHKLCKNDIIVIRGMGIDGSRFLNIKEKEFNTSNNITISFVGELSARKNQDALFQFVKELEEYQINAKLILIGWGENKKYYKARAKKLGLEKQVNFVGFDADICKYFNETDFYVSASKSEGMPFNILEAMYAGKIVFSSDIKGAVDVVKDFETGILFKSGDINNLITKFRIVRNDLELQKKIRKNAKIMAEKYEINSVLPENIEILKKLIG